MCRTDMDNAKPMPSNVVIVAQAGRLQYEAALFCTSFRAAMPRLEGRLLIAEPRPGPRWSGDPRIPDPAVRDLLEGLGAEIVPFETPHFGESYPHGNRVELLAALPGEEPFVFFDSYTLIVGDLPEARALFDRNALPRKEQAIRNRLKREKPWMR